MEKIQNTRISSQFPSPKPFFPARHFTELWIQICL